MKSWVSLQVNKNANWSRALKNFIVTRKRPTSNAEMVKRGILHPMRLRGSIRPSVHHTHESAKVSSGDGMRIHFWLCIASQPAMRLTGLGPQLLGVFSTQTTRDVIDGIQHNGPGNIHGFIVGGKSCRQG